MNQGRQRRITNHLLILEWLTLFFLVGFHFIGVAFSKTDPIIAFCKGHSMEMDHIIQKANGETTQWSISVSMLFTNTLLFYLQMLIVLELVAYIILFYQMHKYNENLKKNGNQLRLSNEQFNKRKRRNVISFAGQFASFLVEIVVTIIFQILVVFHGSNAGNGLVVPIAITSSAILVITFFIASPELRKFYFIHF